MIRELIALHTLAELGALALFIFAIAVAAAVLQ